MNSQGKKVVVGLSGGVDSSVAAHLLIEQGYDVIAVFMKNWHDESVTISDECPWIDDSNDAMLVAEKLGIPFHVLDLSVQYKERIVEYMFSEYEAGRTPNPDVLCNREIKFDVFLDAALKLKADYIATGHYCRRGTSVDDSGNETYHLLAGMDNNKDQSYFLCQLDQAQLSKALFPIGELQKSEVRAIAKDLDLVTAEKKDSQGLCFIGKVKLPTFLQQALKPKRGQIVEIPDEDSFYPPLPEINSESEDNLSVITAQKVYNPNMGEVVGEHTGAYYFTIGQRKGMNVGGRPLPSFVIGTDLSTNTIYTGLGKDHRGLFSKGLFIKNADVHWIRQDLKLAEGEDMDYQVRIRYRQTLFPATLYQKNEGLYIIFQEPQRSVAPGQFAAWYQDDELIGSGVIA